jgi:hypothetical protein
MPSYTLVLAGFCLLGLNTASLKAHAQDSHGSGDAVSGSSPANQERPQDNSSGHSRVDPSPLTSLTQTVTVLFGPSLAEAIRTTRDRVRPYGRPIPVALRRQLAPFFPRTVLEQVRYATAWDPTTDLLPTLFLGSSPKSAMTLGDVILFRDAHGVTDPLLWAHELTHVMQYKRLGVTAFATRYLERGWELEAEAMGRADAIGRQLSP